MYNFCLKLLFISFLMNSTSSHAEACPEKSGKYGNGIQYQNMFCRIFINADSTDDSHHRNITFTDEGLIQIFSNFKGTTNSNSTGARVFYLFPIRTPKEITEVSSEGLKVKHPSGSIFHFNQNGKLSSPDLDIKVSSEINSKNKSGIEIQKYSKGIVIDLGYRMGNTPTLNPNAPVIITDKNLKKCQLLNKDINKIQKDNVQLIYKTNEAFHNFLKKKCPNLDVSDLLQTDFVENLKIVTKPAKIGNSPKEVNDLTNNSKRETNKEKFDDLDAFIDNLEKRNSTSK